MRRKLSSFRTAFTLISLDSLRLGPHLCSSVHSHKQMLFLHTNKCCFFTFFSAKQPTNAKCELTEQDFCSISVQSHLKMPWHSRNDHEFLRVSFAWYVKINLSVWLSIQFQMGLCVRFFSGTISVGSAVTVSVVVACVVLTGFANDSKWWTFIGCCVNLLSWLSRIRLDQSCKASDIFQSESAMLCIHLNETEWINWHDIFRDENQQPLSYIVHFECCLCGLLLCFNIFILFVHSTLQKRICSLVEP